MLKMTIKAKPMSGSAIYLTMETYTSNRLEVSLTAKDARAIIAQLQNAVDWAESKQEHSWELAL